VADAFETITVRSEGFTLSRIIWRRFRRPMEGLVEQTLDANPGLADLGPILPVGTTFRLPVPQARPKPVVVTRLWGASA